MTLNESLDNFTKQGGVFRRRRGQRLSGKTNGALCFLTAVLSKDGQNKTDVILCSYNMIPCGILEMPADHAMDVSKDADSPYADGYNIKYTNPEHDDEFIVTLGASRGATQDDLCVVDVDNPGFVMCVAPDDESIAQYPPFRILGKFMDTYAAVSGKQRHAWVKKI